MIMCNFVEKCKIWDFLLIFLCQLYNLNGMNEFNSCLLTSEDVQSTIQWGPSAVLKLLYAEN